MTKSLATRTLIISITRLMNQGLILLSPIVLVRLLTVEEFGQYREFLLYVTILAAVANVGFSNSLLYFIPSQPESARQLLKQTAAMSFVASIAVTVLAVLADIAFSGTLLGDYRWPVVIYVLCFVNLDFWEFYWLARRKPVSALAYATGRLAMRMAVVIVAAALTGAVQAIIFAVVAFEALRLIASAIMWRRHVLHEPDHASSSWREQMRYCLPLASASVFLILNKSIGNLAVAKFMGPIALAQYTIGTQIQPVVTVLRNSLSDALLPEMADKKERPDPLLLWRRMTVVSMILLVPAAVLLAKFAHPIVTTLFSMQYEGAVAIFQLYVIALLREVFDFGVPLRAINRTGPIARSNFLALGVNIGLLFALLPTLGLIGAVVAFLAARFADGLYLTVQTLKVYDIRLRELAAWSDLLKVAIANAAGGFVLIGSMWTDHLGLFGVVLGALTYMIVVLIMLWQLRVPEIGRLIQSVRHAPAALKLQGR